MPTRLLATIAIFFASALASTPTAQAQLTGSAPTAVNLLIVSPSVMRIDWQDNATGELGYVIQRIPAGTTDWTNATIAQLATPGLATFLDATTSGCANYQYRVGVYDSANTWWSSPDASPGAALAVTTANKMWVSPGTGTGQDGDLTQAATRASILAFAAANGINLIALNAYPYLNKTTVPSNPNDTVNTALTPFINAAYAQGIAVELTYGANNWPTTQTAWSLDLFQNYVVPYLTQTGAYATAGLPPAERVGVELDIESYNSWNKSNWQTGAANLLNYYQSATNTIHGSSTGNPNNLRVDIDLDFWLDSGCWNAAGKQAPCSVTWNGVTGLVSDLATTITDITTIMDYRNNLPWIEAGVSQQLTFANSITPSSCKRVYIGVDSDCANDGTTVAVSCAGGAANATTNATFLSNVLQPLSSYFSSNPYSFLGMAVWHQASWAALP